MHAVHDAAGERVAIRTESAPAPAGAYSQAIRHADVLYISGQTPRLASGQRIDTAAFGVQARQVLENLDRIAVAGGSCLRCAVLLTVYLRDMADAAEFDLMLRDVVGVPPPARVIVPASLTIGAVEITAIVAAHS